MNEEFDDIMLEEDNLSSLDDLTDQVEDSLEDVLSGESIKDGDLIDTVIGNKADPESRQIGITCDDDDEDLDDEDLDDEDDEEDKGEISIDAGDEEDYTELKESVNIFTTDTIIESLSESSDELEEELSKND